MATQLRLVEMPARKPDDDGFQEFWASYPRKVAKAEARRAWQRLRPSVGLRAEISNGLRDAIAHWEAKGTDRQFIPHAATWLRGERWADELDDDDPFAGLK